jgi:hypothetical protein
MDHLPSKCPVGDNTTEYAKRDRQGCAYEAGETNSANKLKEAKHHIARAEIGRHGPLKDRCSGERCSDENRGQERD